MLIKPIVSQAEYRAKEKMEKLSIKREGIFNFGIKKGNRCWKTPYDLSRIYSASIQRPLANNQLLDFDTCSYHQISEAKEILFKIVKDSHGDYFCRELGTNLEFPFYLDGRFPRTVNEEQTYYFVSERGIHEPHDSEVQQYLQITSQASFIKEIISYYEKNGYFKRPIFYDGNDAVAICNSKLTSMDTDNNFSLIKEDPLLELYHSIQRKLKIIADFDNQNYHAFAISLERIMNEDQTIVDDTQEILTTYSYEIQKSKTIKDLFGLEFQIDDYLKMNNFKVLLFKLKQMKNKRFSIEQFDTLIEEFTNNFANQLNSLSLQEKINILRLLTYIYELAFLYYPSQSDRLKNSNVYQYCSNFFDSIATEPSITLPKPSIQIQKQLYKKENSFIDSEKVKIK